jgi:hypothetical protein
MDLQKAIDELIEEKQRIEKAIQCLGEIVAGPAGESRRGRKGMNEAERLEVSERMRRYWAERRRKKKS